MKKVLFSAFIAAILSSACLKNTDSEICKYDPCLQTAPASEVAQVEAYMLSNAIVATKHCSGMYYRIDNAGTGKTPSICNQVVVKYKGQLTNGSTFDERATPVVFNLGTLIEGWKKGLGLIKEGGKIYLYVPPSLGYGTRVITDPNTNNVIIPANSILVFEITLDQVI